MPLPLSSRKPDFAFFSVGSLHLLGSPGIAPPPSHQRGCTEHCSACFLPRRQLPVRDEAPSKPACRGCWGALGTASNAGCEGPPGEQASERVASPVTRSSAPSQPFSSPPPPLKQVIRAVAVVRGSAGLSPPGPGPGVQRGLWEAGWRRGNAVGPGGQRQRRTWGPARRPSGHVDRPWPPGPR